MDDGVKREEPLSVESLAGESRGSRRWLAAGVALAVAGLAAAGYLYWRSGAGADTPQYRTEPVTRGALVVTVSATGSLQPTNKVDIGSELSGTVEAVLVDDNDPVKKGQVLARLDLSRLNDQVSRARSSLAASRARVAQAQATVKESAASLERLRQVRELSGGKVPSQAEMAAAEAALARAHAEEASAAAAVSEAGAALRSDETSLRKATIRSPIDGVVLARKVEPGQTVAASLQAPVLFTLAEDLAQMELQVDVDEADVGSVSGGQGATFTVDAYPARRYPAKVMRVSFGSQVKDGVVSYPTLLSVNNDDLSLRPGMTATAEITTIRREDALLVPNAALRFMPGTASGAPAKSGGIVSQLMPRRPGGAGTPRKAGQTNRGEQRVWVLREGSPLAVPVVTGPSDGRRTEITGGELEAGTEVVVEERRPEEK